MRPSSEESDRGIGRCVIQATAPASFAALFGVSLVRCAFAAAGVWALTGCTLENSSTGGADDVVGVKAWRDDPLPRSFELWNAPGDNLLSALKEVEDNDRLDVLPINNSILGNVFGEAGAYFSAITAYQPFGNSFEEEGEQCEESVLPDAIAEFCEHITEGEQLVFVNELPHAPHYRTFVRKALGCAREAGFSFLAVEALEEDDAALAERGYVSRSLSGHFTREPQMARLLQEAMDVGFKLVSYNVPDQCAECGFVTNIRRHAEQQAENLVAKTIALESEAKVLVLAGPRQSYKETWGDAPFTTSVANYVWEATEIEPYAVEQVSVRTTIPFGESDPSPPSGMYLASGPNNGQCTGDYAPATPNGMPALNSVVVHVPPRNNEDRWGWLHADATERRTVTTTCASCDAGQRLLVQAFPAEIDDISDRVPMDQALCSAGEPCQMVLPAAAYHIVVWSENRQVGSTEADFTQSASAQIAMD